MKKSNEKVKIEFNKYKEILATAIITSALIFILKDPVINNYNKLTHSEAPRTSLNDGKNTDRNFYKTNTRFGQEILLRKETFICPSITEPELEVKYFKSIITSDLLMINYNGEQNFSYPNNFNLILDNGEYLNIEAKDNSETLMEHYQNEILVSIDAKTNEKKYSFLPSTGFKLELRPIDERIYRFDNFSITGKRTYEDNSCYLG